VNKYVSASNVATVKKGLDLIVPRRARQIAARLYVSETRRGNWVVRDEGDRWGGRFFTYEAAMKFIRDEFGTAAQIIATYLVHKKAA